MESVSKTMSANATTVMLASSPLPLSLLLHLSVCLSVSPALPISLPPAISLALPPSTPLGLVRELWNHLGLRLEQLTRLL